MQNLALVLVGGGARAAYQAGVVRALSEMWPEKKPPFNIYTGISAGSVSACLLAHYADDFKTAGEKLWDIWAGLTVDQVFRSDSLSLLRIGSTVLRDLTLGGFFPAPASSHLLDTTPLRKILMNNVDFERIHSHVRSGALKGFGVTATNYHNGCAVTFFDSGLGVKTWARGNHLGEPCILSASHVMASSSIPVFFPPVEIQGRFFGDGSIRLLSPLSPAIHLGANRILAVGLRHAKSYQDYKDVELRSKAAISFADIAGVFLNAVFLDTLDSDLERLRRINHTLKHAESTLGSIPGLMRNIPVEVINPSRDLGTITSGNIERFPWLLKHLLRGLGAKRKRGGDVSAYLAFDKAYVGRLLRLGYKDAMKRADELLKFLKGESAQAA